MNHARRSIAQDGSLLPALERGRPLGLPLVALSFFAVWPQPAWLAVVWGLLPFVVTLPGDHEPLHERAAVTGSYPVPAVLFVLAGLQLATLALACWRISASDGVSVQAIAGLVLLSVSSVVAGAVGGHALIHLRGRFAVWTGRMVLASILYEHFHTEHLRGHHSRFATEEDPATARFGESYWAYLLRTVPGQWRSAWRIESERVGASLWAHQVLQGLVVELGLCAAALAVFGPAGLAVVLIQAVVVQVVFSAVQYFQHWGLVRSAGPAAPHSWDAVDRVSFFNLLGLSLHSEHHMPGEAAPVIPKLPYPYSVMVGLAVVRNRRFQALMTAELRRLGLAPGAEA